jgi:hypothetical protein
MNFWVGQKVVCIKDDWLYEDGLGIIHPVKDSIYTIRDKNFQPENARCPLGLRFVELVNAIYEFRDGVDEPAWDARSFRPLVEEKTDISIFTRVLTPTRVPEKVQ